MEIDSLYRPPGGVGNFVSGGKGIDSFGACRIGWGSSQSHLGSIYRPAFGVCGRCVSSGLGLEILGCWAEGSNCLVTREV